VDHNAGKGSLDDGGGVVLAAARQRVLRIATICCDLNGVVAAIGS